MLNFFKVVPSNYSVKKQSALISHSYNSTINAWCNIDDEVQLLWKDWGYSSFRIKNIKMCCFADKSDYLVLLSQHIATRKITLEVHYISNQLGRIITNLVSNCSLDSKCVVTALSGLIISEIHLCLSIGLDDGSILFYKGILQKPILPNEFKLYDVTIKPIKGIKYSEKGEVISMFVCSDMGIFRYIVSSNFVLHETKLILDDTESPIYCITLKPSYKLDVTQYLVVAHDDGLYCYTEEGRGPCYAISGPKQTIEWFGKQFIIIVNTNFCLRLQQTISQVLIFDTDNKVIVMNKEFGEIACLFPNSNSNCLILMKTGEIYTIREHEIGYKVAHLLKKKFYEIALKILEESKANNDFPEILIQCGDYLLQRGDCRGAVEAYSKTIGNTSPFLIIKKLIDIRFNDFLIQYLNKLVHTDFKIPEHIELLNKCDRRTSLLSYASDGFEENKNKIKQFNSFYTNAKYNLNTSLTINNAQYEYTNIIKFVLDNGYYIIKENPTELKELTKYSLSDSSLKTTIFKKLLLPLSLMNKLCARYLVDSLITDSDKSSMYNILTELLLQVWCRGEVDGDFVIEFLKSHQPKKHIDNIFVICRHYKFWAGIKIMCDKCTMNILGTNCLSNSFKITLNYNAIYSEELRKKNLNHMMIQTLKKGILSKTCSLKNIIDIVKNIVYSNPYYILDILNNFVICTDLTISDFDEYRIEEKYITHFKCDEFCTIVSLLESRVSHMEEVLCNYSRRPIEFRNRLCDICKITIKQPSVYFLCEHSFHKECFLQFSELFMCIICNDIRNSKLKIENADISYEDSYNVSTISMLLEISKKIRQLSF